MHLLDAIPTEVDVETLLLEIRSGAGEASRHGIFGGPTPGACSAKRDAVLTQLTEVERNASLVGTQVPEFVRFGRFKRRLARFTSRVVLYLARVVTAPQRQVNYGLLQALRTAVTCLKEEEAARLELQARVQLLERTVAALRTQATQESSKTEGPTPSGRTTLSPHVFATRH
ncbi:MAG: hypothetical protein SGJ19_04020 [Planctomycetia bacterium]|nr:hypothetical protein [Planctomycetia bacterium]